MRLATLEPWISAVAFALVAGLCCYVASLSGYIADLIRLNCRVCGHAHLFAAPRHRRWRALRRTYLALAISCASVALSFVGIALGWW